MCFPAQAGTILHKVQSIPAAAPFLVSVARAPSATIRNVLSPPRACRPMADLSRRLQKMRSEAHCPNVLTVYYFKTSSGGIPAPSGSIPYRHSAASVGGPLTREPNFCGVHSLHLHGDIGWSLAPRGAKRHRACVGYWPTVADDGDGQSKELRLSLHVSASLPYPARLPIIG